LTKRALGKTIRAPEVPAVNPTEQLRPASSAADLLRDPIGRYLAGRSFVIWVKSPTLAGTIYFGATDAEDLPALVELFALPIHAALATPFDAVIDSSRVTNLSLSSFEALGQNVEMMAPLAARMRRVACVRPPGMAGSTLAGVFYERVVPRFNAALFTDASEAFAWLGRPDAAAACDEAERIVGELVAAPIGLRNLREYLAGRLSDPTLEGAARHLGSSPRTLQRTLLAAGTNFRQEVDRARARAAEAWLLDSDDKVEAIARQVGCSSSSHFATLFRRVTGETPGDFRARRR
jgi:AraC-like DNA-binding protein